MKVQHIEAVKLGLAIAQPKLQTSTVGRVRWYSTVTRRRPRKGGLGEYANPPYGLQEWKAERSVK